MCSCSPLPSFPTSPSFTYPVPLSILPPFPTVPLDPPFPPAQSWRLKSTGEKQVGQVSSARPEDRVRAPRPLLWSGPPPVKAEDDSGPSCHLSSTRRLVMAVSRQRSSPSNGIFSPGPGWSQWLFLARLQINQQLHFGLLRRCKVLQGALLSK